jgi:hypothetical protein
VTHFTYYRWRKKFGGLKTDQVERIWWRERLNGPQKRPKTGRLWLNDGYCIHMQSKRPNDVWSYDFFVSRTHDGGKFRMLNLIGGLCQSNQTEAYSPSSSLAVWAKLNIL